MTDLHRGFKRRKVNLAQRAFINHDVDIGAIFLLVVAHKMFSAGPDPLALDALDFGRRKLASKVRILAGHVFEVAAIQRYPVKIHARSFDRKVTARAGVLSHADALFVGQGWVPGCSQDQP